MLCVYIHRGYNDYLDNIFALTRHCNKNNRIILIGDKENYNIAKKHSIEHYSIHDYEESMPYHHVSVNTESYEKFCFSRWFILKNFLNKHSIQNCIYSDSDNAILYDFTSLHYENACLGHSTVVVPNMFFCSSNYIDAICNYYTQLYNIEYDEFFSKITTSKYITYHENNIQKPHFSDMMFLRMAIDELHLHFDVLAEKPGGKYCFNANINDVKTKIIEDKVYIENTDTYLLNIHFAGNAKSFIKNYLILLNK